MALPSLAIKCKLHQKLIVLLKRHGVNHFSHICTVQTLFFNLVGHMEHIKIFRTNLGTTWQNQSYKHVAVIIFNPSHAWSFQKLRISCQNLWQSIVYTVIHLYPFSRVYLNLYLFLCQASNPSKQETSQIVSHTSCTGYTSR